MKMKIILLAVISSFLLLLLGIDSSQARRRGSTGGHQIQKTTDRPVKDFRVHQVGTLWNMVTNYGGYGDPNSANPSMDWPGGSETYYLWEGRFWIGAILGGEKLCSHADYGDYEFYPMEGSEFFFGPGKAIQDHTVVFDDLYEQGEHIPIGFEVHERGMTWSMPDYDDFLIYEYEIINVSGSTLNGVFTGWIYDADVAALADPSSPHIDDMVDYDGWDGDDSDTDEADWVDPMDLDGDGETGYDEWGWPYGYAMMSGPLPRNPNYDPSRIEPDGLYDEFTVIEDERGEAILFDTDVTIGDVSYSAGDMVIKADGSPLIGWKISRNSSYIWDGDDPMSAENDIGERGAPTKIPGLIAGRLIYSDICKKDASGNYMFGDVFPYNQLPDFQNFPEDTLLRPYAHQWWNWESDPGDDIEKYDYLSAQHSASTQMGEHYYFLRHPFDYNAPVFDYRFIMSTGPFNGFGPLDTLRFVFAAGVGRGHQGMREVMDNALKAYYAGSGHSDPYNPSDFVSDDHYVLPIPPPMPQLTYSPMDKGVRLAWDNLAETAIDAMLGAPDFEGYKIYRSMYNPSGWEMIAAFDNLPDSVVYVINTDGDTLNPGNPVDLPDLEYVYEDTGGTFLGMPVSRPVNGLKYFYSVVAYDPYKPSTPLSPSLPSMESSKANYMKEESGAPSPVIPTKLYEVEEIGVKHDLTRIKVVPNPYKGTALFESRYEDKVRFTQLPPACKISIFTLTGDLVNTIYHTDGSDAELWNLLSRNGQAVVSGLYLFVVEVEEPGYDKYIGKFVIIRG